jgi:hypothetical protein
MAVGADGAVVGAGGVEACTADEVGGGALERSQGPRLELRSPRPTTMEGTTLTMPMRHPIRATDTIHIRAITPVTIVLTGVTLTGRSITAGNPIGNAKKCEPPPERGFTFGLLCCDGSSSIDIRSANEAVSN